LELFQAFPGPVSGFSHNMLEMLYTGKCSPMVFQSFVLACNVHEMQKRKKTISNASIVFAERSVASVSEAFGPVVLHRAWERDLLSFMHKTYVTDDMLNYDVLIYLRCPPEIALSRMKSRGRMEESGLSLPYFQELHLAHERWCRRKWAPLNVRNVFVIDSDDDLERVANVCMAMIKMSI